MASLLTHTSGNKSGCRYIRFVRGDKRPMIYLGRTPQRVAETILRHVEDLISAKAGGMAPMPATAKWLTTIDDALVEKLVNAGLIEPRQDASHAVTLGPAHE